MDGVMQALAKKKTQWTEDLFFTVKLARSKLSKYYTEVPPLTAMHLYSAHILNPFQKLQSFSTWDERMDINPEEATSCTTHYKEAFLKYGENEYCAKHRHVPVNELETLPSCNPDPSATASGSYKSSFAPYDLFSNNEEFLTPNNVPEITSG
jgi:hypothetical protein